MNRLVGFAGACLFLVHGFAAAAGSIYFSEPAHAAAQKVSTAADPRAYRLDAARHFYDEYAPRIFRGRLPPLIHAVVVVETRSTRTVVPATCSWCAARRMRRT